MPPSDDPNPSKKALNIYVVGDFGDVVRCTFASRSDGTRVAPGSVAYQIGKRKKKTCACVLRYALLEAIPCHAREALLEAIHVTVWWPSRGLA
jgi:hypothetical protein